MAAVTIMRPGLRTALDLEARPAGAPGSALANARLGNKVLSLSPFACLTSAALLTNTAFVMQDFGSQRQIRKSAMLELVRARTGRDPVEIIRELYVGARASDQDIADALSAKLDFPISRASVNAWRRSFGITRDERPAVSL